MQTLLFILGTRPEAIKLAPVILYAKAKQKQCIVKVCITAQHREMLDDVLSFFSIKPDFDLNLMKPGQKLASLSSAIFKSLPSVFEASKPSVVIVQGDTTTAMVAGLAAFYERIPVAHVEAGLRSFSNEEPFPEEVNRKMISQFAQWHFAPTATAFNHLKSEKVLGNLFITGNTVIDALLLGKKKLLSQKKKFIAQFPFLQNKKRTILVTVHRRENFGEPLLAICKAIEDTLKIDNDLQCIIPVHPNPMVKNVLEKYFKNNDQVRLVQPLAYDELIWVMMHSYLIMTDSGGIQEEAPSLGKPVLVLRNVTERIEGVKAGTALLCGNGYKKIFTAAKQLLTNKEMYTTMANATNPYGDGQSSKAIIDNILKDLSSET